MKLYLISLAVGVLVGAIYGLLNVRSPAPPVVALIGLAGILIGEQLVPLAKHWWTQGPVSATVFSAHLKSHSLASLPTQSPDCGRACADSGSAPDKT
ncbi:XapX domain-containing protein [Dokdonella soli]|uniref:XapX domain-containing protein n=1 Tax=Dokdonella soli TaxID=529810 RepID=A0ABN1IDC9_9GAMM